MYNTLTPTLTSVFSDYRKIADMSRLYPHAVADLNCWKCDISIEMSFLHLGVKVSPRVCIDLTYKSCSQHLQNRFTENPRTLVEYSRYTRA